MSDLKPIKVPWEFSGQIELSADVMSALESLPNSIIKQKEEIVLNVLNNLLPDFKIDSESAKRITRVIHDDKVSESYYLDLKTENEIFLFAIKDVYDESGVFIISYELLIPNNINT